MTVSRATSPAAADPGEPQGLRPTRRQFASDNYSGVCLEAWAAMAEANGGHLPSYGNDPWTYEASELLRQTFESDCEVFFVFNGTAANSLALASLCQSYHSVLCHELAHVETDECGAPEFFSNGTKLLLLPGESGRIAPAQVERAVLRRTDIHYPKPRVLSLTQPTELGTVYRLDELTALRDVARRHDLAIHMDGARFANAIAALDTTPRALIDAAGVDVLCLGGTKNGMAYGEAVVFFNRDLADEFDYRCKQAGQLASKMRFLTAQWVGLLRDEVWLRNARHANAMAAALEERVREIPDVQILHPRQANSLFIRLTPNQLAAMHARGWILYDFIGGGARLMCSWDTTVDDVDAIAIDLAAVLSGDDARRIR